nr:unnamed protein product [Callosobruchus chinensis]
MAVAVHELQHLVCDERSEFHGGSERINLHNAPQVLAKRGTKRVHFVAHEHGKNVTVVSCGNALGQAIPPMILFKGKRLKPEWKDALPSGTTVQMTPKGSMNVAVFVQWIHHLAKYKLPGPCVVVFDGAKCHLDYSIVEAAEKFDIKLFCLPSNTTHELQPMDKSVFRSFEYFWDEEVLKYWAQHEEKESSVLLSQHFSVKESYLCLWSDNCNGQNKGKMVLIALIYHVATGEFSQIDQQFLVSGHTYLPCDRGFAQIEKRKRVRKFRSQKY